MSIPHTDDFSLPPHLRTKPSVFDKVAAAAYFSDRDRAFTPYMDLGLLLPFLRKYRIPHADPTASPKLHPNNQLQFWAMCYTAILVADLGVHHRQDDEPDDGTKIRATIWLHQHRATPHRPSNCVTWCVASASYTINNRLFYVPPKLVLKR